MPGYDEGLVGENKEAASNGIENLIEITTGEVGAPDASGEKRIAGEDRIERDEMEADGALGVTGGVDDPGRKGSEPDGLAIDESFVWRGRLGGADAQPCGLLVHDVELGKVVLIEENWRACEPLEFESSADVIDVGVSDEDLFEGESEGSKAVLNSTDLVAGVDDNGFARGLVAEDGAVALQRADREGLEDHGSIVGASGSRDGVQRCGSAAGASLRSRS